MLHNFWIRKKYESRKCFMMGEACKIYPTGLPGQAIPEDGMRRERGCNPNGHSPRKGQITFSRNKNRGVFPELHFLEKTISRKPLLGKGRLSQTRLLTRGATHRHIFAFELLDRRRHENVPGKARRSTVNQCFVTCSRWEQQEESYCIY